ncbi:TPA: respiratory nitrate reductase subunit gamma [Escherichia coli]
MDPLDAQAQYSELFIFRLHLVLGMTLFLLFPFSRLVHIWSVPVEYLTRKYQLVRARH